MVVTAILKVKEEYVKEVEDRLIQMVRDVTEKEEGTLEYRLHKDMADPCVFYFYEQYKNKAAFELHSKSEDFKDLFAYLLPKLDGEPKLSMYKMIQ